MLIRVGAFVVTLLLWWGIAAAHILSNLALATPTATFHSLDVLLLTGSLTHPFIRTISEILIALVFSLLLGSVAGVIMGASERANLIFNPYLSVALVMPMSVLLPLLELVFGVTSILTASFFAILITVFPTMVIVSVAVKNLSRTLITAAKLMGASSTQLLLHVYFRGALRSIMTALRLGVILVIVGVLITEMYVQQPLNPGVGALISEFSNNFQIGNMYAVIFLVTMMTIALNEVLFYVEQKWHW